MVKAAAIGKLGFSIRLKKLFFFNKNTHRERKSVFVGIRDVLRNASVLR